MADATEKPSELEFVNKERARHTVRQINRRLTDLKNQSIRPPERLETDQTGKFITVPAQSLRNTDIEEAYVEAEKKFKSSLPPANDKKKEKLKSRAKKKWFKWD